MVIMISYRLFILNSIFLFFTASVLLRVLQKNIVSILDFGILFLTLSIGFLLNKLIVFNNVITKQSIYYLIFLTYIVFNIVFFSFYRVFELNIDFFDIFLAIFAILVITALIINVIPEKNKNEKTKDWNVEILEIKSKYKNDEISFEKARKMIKKIKRQKKLSEEEHFLKEENLRILEEEISILNGNQEKSVWL